MRLVRLLDPNKQARTLGKRITRNMEIQEAERRSRDVKSEGQNSLSNIISTRGYD